MNKTIITLAAVMSSSFVIAGEAVDQFNQLGYGTISGRLQTLSMYRDYENGNNNQSSTLGIKLDYVSPTKEGWTIGMSYIGAAVLDSMDYDTSANPGDALVANGRVNLLNEAYLSYDMSALGLTNTTVTAGRRVNNGEVFRADDFRQKPRALETFMVETRAFHKTRLLAGYAWEMSNWIDADPRWKFEEFDRSGTDGVTWAEVVNNCVENLEVAVFDAYAQDLANLAGARAKFKLSDETAVLAYLRHEDDVGDASGHSATACGLSLEQKVNKITFEGGYFGVGGDGLVFQETSTGINHALGSSMMIYAGQFNGGADTLYAKAVTKLQTGTVLYGLYNYTLLDESKSNMRQAQELNIVIKQPVPRIDNLMVCFKGGIGTRDGIKGTDDTTATDARLFVTYTF